MALQKVLPRFHSGTSLRTVICMTVVSIEHLLRKLLFKSFYSHPFWLRQLSSYNVNILNFTYYLQRGDSIRVERTFNNKYAFPGIPGFRAGAERRDDERFDCDENCVQGPCVNNSLCYKFICVSETDLSA